MKTIHSHFHSCLIYKAERTGSWWREQKYLSFETATQVIRTQALSIESPAFYRRCRTKQKLQTHLKMFSKTYTKHEYHHQYAEWHLCQPRFTERPGGHWTKDDTSLRDFSESIVSGCVDPRNVSRIRAASTNWYLARANEFVAKWNAPRLYL